MANPRGPRGPYKTGIDRRAQILEKAIEVFGARGYSGSTLREIADLVGVTPAAITVHFAGKEGLLVEVLRFWGERQMPTVVPVDLNQFFKSLRVLMEYHRENRGLLQLYLRLQTEASEESHPAHAFVVARNRETLDGFVSRLRRASDSGEISPLGDAAVEQEARSLLAVIEGIEMQWILDPAVDLVGVVGQYLELTTQRLRRVL